MTDEIESYYDSELNFFKVISQSSLSFENESALMGYTAVDSEHLNLVLQKNPLVNLEYAFDSASNFFKKNGCPAWSWLIKEDLVSDEFLSYASHYGYSEVDHAIAMVCDLEIKFKFTSSDILTIKECNDNLALWAKPLEKAFESTQEIMTQYTAAHQRSPATSRILKHYVGLIERQPVTALTVSSCNTSVRLDDVGTDPSFQGRGYATELIKYALYEAKSLGAKKCYLGASPQGLSVYEKIGFKPLFNIGIFVQNESELNE